MTRTSDYARAPRPPQLFISSSAGGQFLTRRGVPPGGGGGDAGEWNVNKRDLDETMIISRCVL